MFKNQGFTIIQTIVTVAIIATISSFSVSMVRDGVVRQRGLAETSKIIALEEAKRLWASENLTADLDGGYTDPLQRAFHSYGQLRPYLQTSSGGPATVWASIDDPRPWHITSEHKGHFINGFWDLGVVTSSTANGNPSYEPWMNLGDLFENGFNDVSMAPVAAGTIIQFEPPPNDSGGTTPPPDTLDPVELASVNVLWTPAQGSVALLNAVSTSSFFLNSPGNATLRGPPGAQIPILVTPATGYTVSNVASSGVSVSPNAITENAYIVNMPSSTTASASVIFSFEEDSETFTLTINGSPANAFESITGSETEYEANSTANWVVRTMDGWQIDSISGDHTATPSNGTTFYSNSILMDSDKNITVTAEQIRFNLTLVSNPEGSGTLTQPSDGYLKHSNVNINASPSSDNWVFLNWERVSGSDFTTTTLPLASVDMQDHTVLRANFALNQYLLAITATPPEGGTVSGGGTFPHGDVRSFSASENTGYIFSGFTGSYVGATPIGSILMDGSKNIVANFSPISYPLTIVADPTEGGTTLGAGSYVHNSTASFSASPSAGYNFVGFSGDFSGSELTGSILMNSPKNIVANFVTAPMTDLAIQKSSYGNDVDSPVWYSLYLYNYSDLDATGVVVIDVLPDGASFNSDFSRAGSTYDPLTRTITWSAGDISAGDSLSAWYSVNYSTTGVKTNVANVTSNELDYNLNNNTDSSTVELYDSGFEVTVTANPPEAADYISGGGTYFPGSSVYAEVGRVAGWRFTGWTGDLVAGGTYAGGPSSSYPYAWFNMPGNDVNLVANFESLPSYTLSLVVLNAATGNPIPQSDYTLSGFGPYLVNTLANVSVTYSSVNWDFDRWEGVFDGFPDPSLFTTAMPVFMDSDKQGILYLRPKAHRLTMLVNPEGAGTVSQTNPIGLYPVGDTASFSASAATGNSFNNFSYAEGGSSGVTVTNSSGQALMNRDRVIVANFNVGRANLTVIPVPSEGGTTSGSGNYAMTSTASFSATPNSGYSFVSFTGDLGGHYVDGWGNNYVAMTSDRVIYANFVETENLPSDPLVTKAVYNYYSSSPIWYMDDYYTYTVSVSNQGPSVARDVQVVDAMPSDFTVYWMDASEGSVSQSGNVLTWNVGDIPPGTTYTLNYDGEFASVGTKTNTATVTTTTLDSDLTNNESVVSFEVYDNSVRDLSLVKSVSSHGDGYMGEDADGTSVVSSGSEFVYVLNLNLAGPSSASSVTVVDTLPLGVEGLRWELYNGWGESSSGSISSSTFTVNVGQVWPGDTASIYVYCRAPIVTEETRLTNTAVASSNLEDANPSNNTASVDTVFVPSSVDMGISKSASPLLGSVGSEMTWNVFVMPGSYSYTMNSGRELFGSSHYSGGFTVEDVVPDGMEIVSVSSTFPNFSYSVSEQTVVARFDAPTTMSESFSIVCVPLNLGRYTNVATLNLDETEDNLSNNTATATYIVSPITSNVPNVSVTKSVSPGVIMNSPALHSGATTVATYTLRVTNTGTTPVDGIVLTDILPEHMATASPLTWNVGTLAPGAHRQYTYTATASIPNLTSDATLYNRAIVTTSTPNEDTSNNEVSVPLVVTPSLVDLDVIKTGPETVFAGGRMTYSISFSTATPPNGTWANAWAYDLVLTDVLPDGLSYVSHSYSSTSSSVPDISFSDGTLSLVWSTPFRGSGTVTLVVDVSNTHFSNGDIISNTASVTTASYDPIPENNSSTWSTIVVPISVSLNKWAQNTSINLSENTHVSWVLEVVNNTDVTIDSATVVDYPPGGGSPLTFYFNNLAPMVPQTRSFSTPIPVGSVNGTVLENQASLTLPSFPFYGPISANATVLLTDYFMPPMGEVSRWSSAESFFAWRYGFGTYNDIGVAPNVDIQLFKERAHLGETSAAVDYSSIDTSAYKNDETGTGSWFAPYSASNYARQNNSGGGSSNFSIAWTEEMVPFNPTSPRNTSTKVDMRYGAVSGNADITSRQNGSSGGSWTWNDGESSRTANGSWNMSTRIDRSISGESAIGYIKIDEDTTTTASGTGRDRWRGWYSAGWSVSPTSPPSWRNSRYDNYSAAINGLNLLSPPNFYYNIQDNGNPPYNAHLSAYSTPFSASSWSWWSWATYPNYAWWLTYKPGSAKGIFDSGEARRVEGNYTGTFTNLSTWTSSDQVWNGGQSDSDSWDYAWEPSWQNGGTWGTSVGSNSYNRWGNYRETWDLNITKTLSSEFTTEDMMALLPGEARGAGMANSAFCRLGGPDARSVSARSTKVTVLVSIPYLKSNEKAVVEFQIVNSASYVVANRSIGRTSGGNRTVRETRWVVAEEFEGPRLPRVEKVELEIPFSRNITIKEESYSVGEWNGNNFTLSTESDASGRVRVKKENQ